MGTHRDEWQVDSLDLSGYLARLGMTADAVMTAEADISDTGDPTGASGPTRARLDALHEAHVRAFTFDNLDVFLGQHPGVSLAAVQEKFVGRGRGGYCFEHSTIFAAALERLGYRVRRHLGRVGDPATGTQQGRTHMVVEVLIDGERLLCDPGFGMSLLRPIPLADGAEDEQRPGWRYRVRHTEDDAWALLRERDGGWEITHTTDELPVRPVDVAMGHHWTSTFPGSHFTTGVTVTRHLPDRHVTVTEQTLTIRTPGRPTEHRPLGEGELDEWLDRLEVPLSGEERDRLSARLTKRLHGS